MLSSKYLNEQNLMASETDEKGDGKRDASKFTQLYVLNVLVSEARNLRAADINGKSDPFVKVKVVDKKYGEMGAFETEVIEKNNKNPKWDKLHVFSFFNEPCNIIFEVWDYDEGVLNGRHDELGTFALNVKELNLFPISNKTQKQTAELRDDYQMKDKWHKLVHIDTRRKGRRDTNAGKPTKGELKISIKGETLFPYETEKRLLKMTGELETVITEKKENEKKMNENINKLNINISTLNDKIKEKDVQLTQFELELNENKEEINKIKNVLNNTQTDKIKQERKCVNLQREIDRLNDELKTKDNKKESSGAVAKEKEGEAAGAAATNGRIETLQKELDGKNGQIEQLRNRIHELELNGDDDESASLLNGDKDKQTKTGNNCCIVM